MWGASPVAYLEADTSPRRPVSSWNEPGSLKLHPPMNTGIEFERPATADTPRRTLVFSSSRPRPPSSGRLTSSPRNDELASLQLATPRLDKAALAALRASWEREYDAKRREETRQRREDEEAAAAARAAAKAAIKERAPMMDAIRVEMGRKLAAARRERADAAEAKRQADEVGFADARSRREARIRQFAATGEKRAALFASRAARLQAHLASEKKLAKRRARHPPPPPRDLSEWYVVDRRPHAERSKSARRHHSEADDDPPPPDAEALSAGLERMMSRRAAKHEAEAREARDQELAAMVAVRGGEPPPPPPKADFLSRAAASRGTPARVAPPPPADAHSELLYVRPPSADRHNKGVAIAARSPRAAAPPTPPPPTPPPPTPPRSRPTAIEASPLRQRLGKAAVRTARPSPRKRRPSETPEAAATAEPWLAELRPPSPTPPPSDGAAVLRHPNGRDFVWPFLPDTRVL